MISGCYPCQVIARSSETPIEGNNLFYTIRIFTPEGAIDKTGVRPQAYYRRAMAEQSVVLEPFDLMMRLQCTVIRDGNNERIDLQNQEVPGMSPCAN